MLWRLRKFESLAAGREDSRWLPNLTSCRYSAERQGRVSYCHMTVLQLFLEQEKRWN